MQMHHIDGNHWVLSTSIGTCGVIQVYDSNKPDNISNDLMRQLNSLYSADGSDVCAEMMNCPQQINMSDCGVYVIAFAIELLQGQNLSSVEFDQGQMRPHLLQCFLNEKLTAFPKIQTINECRDIVVCPDKWSGLSPFDKQSLSEGQYLTDGIMDSVSDILKKQKEPQLDHCLNHVFHCYPGDPFAFSGMGYEGLQFHHFNFHWVLSSTIGQTLKIFDSLKRSNEVDVRLLRQLNQLYGVNQSYECEVLNCQQQDNSSDCGVFAIANAVELVLGDVQNVASIRYDTTKMREHLKECLRMGEMRPFPRQQVIKQIQYGIVEESGEIDDGEVKMESSVPPCYTVPFGDEFQYEPPKKKSFAHIDNFNANKNQHKLEAE